MNEFFDALRHRCFFFGLTAILCVTIIISIIVLHLCGKLTLDMLIVKGITLLVSVGNGYFFQMLALIETSEFFQDFVRVYFFLDILTLVTLVALNT